MRPPRFAVRRRCCLGAACSSLASSICLGRLDAILQQDGCLSPSQPSDRRTSLRIPPSTYRICLRPALAWESGSQGSPTHCTFSLHLSDDFHRACRPIRLYSRSVPISANSAVLDPSGRGSIDIPVDGDLRRAIPTPSAGLGPPERRTSTSNGRSTSSSTAPRREFCAPASGGTVGSFTITYLSHDPSGACGRLHAVPRLVHPLRLHGYLPPASTCRRSSPFCMRRTSPTRASSILEQSRCTCATSLALADTPAHARSRRTLRIATITLPESTASATCLGVGY
ncbi:hypothetical protein OH76DRAFT_254936 [Lentinus brumalis]|uniref:Uncharacterized protein n=1 Tax=Lentinus brumalis TaxID=2498619 RepID=A0A371CL92_9APHY|nr:hypothetical protein OH76DRAFT_254936 [Polyporus brumalis]